MPRLFPPLIEVIFPDSWSDQTLNLLGDVMAQNFAVINKWVDAELAKILPPEIKEHIYRTGDHHWLDLYNIRLTASLDMENLGITFTFAHGPRLHVQYQRKSN